MIGLLYGENLKILTSTVFAWITRVSDGRTDGRNCDSICALTAYMMSRAKKKLIAITCILYYIDYTYHRRRADILRQDIRPPLPPLICQFLLSREQFPSSRCSDGSSFISILETVSTGTCLGPTTKPDLETSPPTFGSALSEFIFWPMFSLIGWGWRWSRSRMVSGLRTSTGRSTSATSRTTSIDWTLPGTAETEETVYSTLLIQTGCMTEWCLRRTTMTIPIVERAETRLAVGGLTVATPSAWHAMERIIDRTFCLQTTLSTVVWWLNPGKCSLNINLITMLLAWDMVDVQNGPK